VLVIDFSHQVVVPGHCLLHSLPFGLSRFFGGGPCQGIGVVPQSLRKCRRTAAIPAAVERSASRLERSVPARAAGGDLTAANISSGGPASAHGGDPAAAPPRLRQQCPGPPCCRRTGPLQIDFGPASSASTRRRLVARRRKGPKTGLRRGRYGVQPGQGDRLQWLQRTPR
jgi:hypothetical protein